MSRRRAIGFLFVMMFAVLLASAGGAAGARAVSASGGGGATAGVHPMVAGGYQFSVALRADGSLWAWGQNAYGQLGDGTTTARFTPVQITGCSGGDYNWVAVACGDYHTVAVKSDGTLWAWGYNGSGRLGDGTTVDKHVPTLVSGGNNWTAVACGSAHTVAVKSDGTLWAWGYNSYGQLGLGSSDSTAHSTPAQVGTAVWTAVACSAYHTAAIKGDGTLWAWGDNSYGQVGDGTMVEKDTPTAVSGGGTWSAIACGSGHTAAIKADGTLWAWGLNSIGELGDGTTTNRSAPTSVSGGGTWSTVAAGAVQTAAIKADGTLWAWGGNGSGQLGDGTTTSKSVPTAVSGGGTWTTVAGGYQHTLGIKADGAIYAWGDNSNGALGDGTTSSRYLATKVRGLPEVTCWTDVAAAGYHSAAIKADGSLWAWGDNAGGQLGDGTTTPRSSPVQVTGCTGGDYNWVAVACSSAHTVGLKADGTLWAWGVNGGGQLGDGTTTNRLVPTLVSGGGTWTAVACGAGHTVAIKSDGSVWAWGSNFWGQLGDGTTTNRSVPTVVSGGGTWAVVACGTDDTIGIKTDGTLLSWGHNTNGKLGVGSGTMQSVPTAVSGGGTWAAVACGDSHTVAIRADGTLWAWGYNGDGEIGDGTTTTQSVPTAVSGGGTWAAVACGSSHTVAVKSDGSLSTWGYNAQGQLGDGTITNRLVPVVVGGGSSWTAVAAGTSHSVALRADGSPWAWGSNNNGQLGDGSTTQRTLPAAVSARSRFGWSSVASGPLASFGLGIKPDGSLWAWGFNGSGTLGDGTTTNRVSPVQITGCAGGDYNWAAVSCGNSFTVALKTNGSLWAWGDNTYGQLGDGTTVAKSVPTQISAGSWSAISAGGYHAVALRPDGTLYAWGDNNNGQLGINSTVNASMPTQVAGTWRTAAAGQYFSLATKPDGSLWSWGQNTYGQLGINSTSNSLVPAAVAAGTAWRAIACGGNHALGIRSDGVLLAWGQNSSGQVGDSTTVNKLVPTGVTGGGTWSAIAAGAASSFATRADGTLWDWGNDVYGQLGDGLTANKTAPSAFAGGGTWTALAPGNFQLMALRADGTLMACGYNASGQLGVGTTVNAGAPRPVVDPADLASVSSGDGFTAAVKADGTLWTWGYNNAGQLGDGTTSWRISPVQVTGCSGGDSNWVAVSCGYYHTLALKEDGSLWAWGLNSSGQLGNNSTTNSLVPINVSGGATWKAIAAGDAFSAAIKADGSLWTWGANANGQLGNNSTTSSLVPVAVNGGGVWTAVSAGGGFATGLKADGSLWSWGLNSSGQLGINSTTNSLVPAGVSGGGVWTAVSAGGFHTAAIKADGSLWTWGLNGYGQLGNNSTNVSTVPVTVSGGGVWTAVSAGGWNTAAVKADGSLWSWGYNTYGQLGDNTLVDKHVPTAVSGGGVWAALSCGFYHSAAIDAGGHLRAWGFNGHGEVGDGTMGTTRMAPTFVVDLSDVNPPELSGISSSTHPSDSIFYSNSNPVFTWTALSDHSGVTGYSYVLDHSPTAVPDKVSEGSATTVSYTGKADGTWFFHVHAVDGAGNWGATLTRRTLIDATAPTGSLTINGGDAVTVSTNVTLTVTGSDLNGPLTVSIRNAGGSTTGPLAFGTGSFAWALDAAGGDGTKTVQVQLVDSAGNSSSWISDSIDYDTTAPSGGVMVGDGSGYANSRTVTVHPAATDPHGPIQMQVRNAGDAWPAGWTALGDVSLTLPTVEGYKTVEVRYRDGVGNVSAPISTTVILDTTASIGWLTVADGAAAVNSTSTSVEYWANDLNGVVAVRLRNGGDAWPVWMPVTGGVAGGSQAWALPTTGDGPKTVCVEFKDAAGNITMIERQVILDTTAPTGALTIDGGAYATSDPAATLGLTAVDANAPIDMRLRDAGQGWGDWQPHDASVPWTLPGSDGEKAVEVQYRDIAGNASPVIDGAIVLDRIAPTLAPASVGAGAWCRWSDSAAANASDAGSGLAASAQRYRVDGGAWTDGSAVTLKTTRHGDHFNGAHTVEFQSADRAGNVTTGSVTVRLDSMGPLTGNDAPTGTVTTPVTVTLSPVDAGCGVAATWHAVDGGGWSQGTAVALTPPASGTVTHTISYFSVDKLGNAEAFRSVTVTMAAALPVQVLQKALVRWTPVRPAVR